MVPVVRASPSHHGAEQAPLVRDPEAGRELRLAAENPRCRRPARRQPRPAGRTSRRRRRHRPIGDRPAFRPDPGPSPLCPARRSGPRRPRPTCRPGGRQEPGWSPAYHRARLATPGRSWRRSRAVWSGPSSTTQAVPAGVPGCRGAAPARVRSTTAGSTGVGGEAPDHAPAPDSLGRIPRGSLSRARPPSACGLTGMLTPLVVFNRSTPA